VTRSARLSSPLELLNHRPMGMKFSRGMCMPCAGHSLLRVCSSAELVVNWTSKLSCLPASCRETKNDPVWSGWIMPRIMIVLKQSRDDYVICLPLATRGHSKYDATNGSTCEIEIIHKFIQTFNPCVNTHTVLMCFVGSENKQRLFPYTLTVWFLQQR